MDSPIARRRIELATALHGRVGELLRLEPGKLRFSLGVSLADLKLPFHVTPEAAGIFAQSARQLALMLLSRHRSLITSDEFDRYLLFEEFSNLPQVPPTLSPASGGPDIRAAAELAPHVHPLLTGGVMTTWLGPGGGGRSLVALLLELLRRAFAEMQGTRGREDTPVLVALMLSSLLPGVEQGLRALELPPSIERTFLAATTTGVHLALRLGVERVLREHQAPAELGWRVDAILGPIAVLGGPKPLLTAGSTLYGCELLAGAPDAERVVAQHAEGLPVAAVQAALERSLAADDTLARRAELAVGIAALRTSLLRTARLGESGALEQPLTHHLRELAIRTSALTALLADDKARKQLAKALLAQIKSPQGAKGEALEELSDALSEYSAKEPAASTGLSRPEARARYAQAATAFVCELWLERTLFPLRRILYPRTGEEVEGGLEAEYQAGRLYWLSTRPEPLLCSAVNAPLAHLFVDVKDFTRRTALLGQAAMADFLRREFYLPILSAAKKHYGGIIQMTDKGGISVNNLLGDALSLSGQVAGMMALAVDIRRHLAAYERQLARAISSEVVESALRAIEEEYERKLRAAKPAMRAYLEREREAALARERGEGLEAGVFLSFGPAPLVITLEDEVFGRSKVAIAEHINESARGTARSAGARAKADAQLEQERQRQGRPSLAHPWAVFVGAPLSLPVSYPVEAEVRAALQARDGTAAMRALFSSVREALEELARQKEGGPGDIYNSGLALSEEMLLAYQEEVGHQRHFHPLELAPESLHPEIHARYFFPPEPLRLMLAFHPSGGLAELFRFAGRVQFKGLERKEGIGVWELVDEYGVGRLLAQYHAEEWFRAAVPAPG